MVFLGTSTGLYSTKMINGASTLWTQEGANSIGNVIVPMLKVGEDGFIAVATHGNGILASSYPLSVDTDKETAFVSYYHL